MVKPMCHLLETEVFHVEVIGEVEPVEVTEKYLAEIISARIKHIFEQIKQDLERRHLLDLPGGIVIIGGGAILPGVEELAQRSLWCKCEIVCSKSNWNSQSSFCPCD